MSNLNSLFDVLGGLPPNGRSALESNFTQKTGESPVLSEGMIVKVENATGDPVITKLTSGNVGATTLPDYPWLVVQGMDQSDANFADAVTCIALWTGAIVRFPTGGTFSIGDLVHADTGAVTKTTGSEQSFGKVINVNSAAGYIDVACGGMMHA